VFGDIGTSPLYALKECFDPGLGIGTEKETVLGVLSLVLWALVAVVSVKYLSFILRADNRGEGGVLALGALLGRSGRARRRALGIGLALFGAALLYGDAIITPAITVLSAFELEPRLEPYAVPCSLVALVFLFAIQHRGTGRVGTLFGPIMGAWFLTLAVLGVVGIVQAPGVLAACSPLHGLRLLAQHGRVGFTLLGVVFLVVTGAEALYADMGHFGRRPIVLAWSLVVLPALLLNYFGQGALLLAHPELHERLLFALAPGWFQGPLLALTLAASLIASQAVISGTFSLTRQAIQLGFCPRMRVLHTSAEEIGQIYVPRVNGLLLAGTLGMVLLFRSSGALASAYGMAVATTMAITTGLFGAVARTHFRWPLPLVLLVTLGFGLVDLAFFGANVTKLVSGGWVALLIGASVYVLMSTWHRGRALLAERLRTTLPSIQEFLQVIRADDVTRVPGKAVFLMGSPDLTPAGMLHNLKHNRVVHSEVAFLTILTEDVPRVADEERVEVRALGDGFYRVLAHYGFMEQPQVKEILTHCQEHGMNFAPEEVSYFLSRQRIVPAPRSALRRWQQKLFGFLSRNSLGATAYFDIPPRQVVELGALVQV